MLEQIGYFYQDPSAESFLGDNQFNRKVMNLQEILGYANNERIPILCNNDPSEFRDKIYSEFGIIPIGYCPIDDNQPKLDEVVTGVLDSNPALAKEMSNLRDGDIVIVGGAHIWVKRKWFMSRIRDYLDGNLYFFGCVEYPIKFIDTVKDYYNVNINIIIDPRITLHGLGTRVLLDNSKLYEVIATSKKEGMMIMKPMMDF